MATRRKTNTALVVNPNRRLSIGGAKVNPARKRRSTKRRRNPVVKAATRRRNPARKSNPPSTITGLLVAAVMAGVGVSVFDVATTKLLPNSSSLIRAGVKLGGAWLFQSSFGAKVPVLGKYKNDIALVLAVAGVVDLMKLYVFPLVSQAVGNIGLLQPAQTVIAIPEASDQTTAGIYGNAYAPGYAPFS